MCLLLQKYSESPSTLAGFGVPKCKRFKGSSGGIQSTFWAKVGPGLGLEQVAQGFIHSKTETLEGQKWHSLPKLPAPLPHCLHRETGSLYTQPELLLRQLLPFLHPRCILHCYEETTSISLMTPHRYWGAVPEAVPAAVLSPGWPSPDSPHGASAPVPTLGDTPDIYKTSGLPISVFVGAPNWVYT